MTKPAPLKFHQLSPQRRLKWLQEHTSLSDENLQALSQAPLELAHADRMIENVVGTYALPLGIAQNFIVNGREVLVPMVIEEPSVVAAASYMAKLARAGGGFTATSTEPEMIGQIQLLDVPDMQTAIAAIETHKEELLEEARCVDCTLTALGGGPRDIEVRQITDSAIGPFLVVHLIHDVRDAMGANAVNTTLERLAPRIEELTGGRVHLRILSNLADRRRTRAEVTIPVQALAFGDYSGESVRDGILEAYAFAAADPYRAATHNKGIMNGIDAVVLATGNDWRAVEAGAHAYAARSGRYTSLTVWSKKHNGDLHGELEL
ncbi:MAG TPA: hydroxymethylglutaryl-CoA reductase, degradative, partial [Bellilinea sp.]|nr:hydroxymethylglutaryl-CoA reductase, degradative [Bellilinea sp.]